MTGFAAFDTFTSQFQRQYFSDNKHVHYQLPTSVTTVSLNNKEQPGFLLSTAEQVAPGMVQLLSG